MKHKIIYYDMNMYFAQIVLLKNPHLKGKPLICAHGGGYKRGVVTTASYEARKFGVRSGMPTAVAYKKCPHGIFMMPSWEDIKYYTKIIREIARTYTDKISSIGFDEAALDMTNTYHLYNDGDINKTALEFQKKILDTAKMTCSVGVGYSMHSAKVAASKHKPNGFASFTDQDEFVEYLADKDIRFLHGVGEQLEIKLHNLGIKKIKDLQEADLGFLRRSGGAVFEQIYWLSKGYDNRKVETRTKQEGYDNSITVPKNLNGIDEIKREIEKVVREVCARIEKGNKVAKTVTVRLRYDKDFRTITRSVTLNNPISSQAGVLEIVNDILENKVEDYSEIRLVGVRLSSLRDVKVKQLKLM